MEVLILNVKVSRHFGFKIAGYQTFGHTVKSLKKIKCLVNMPTSGPIANFKIIFSKMLKILQSPKVIVVFAGKVGNFWKIEKLKNMLC